MTTQQSTSNELKNCIDACLHCYQVCTQMFMGHCLESGGRHVEPEHARLMTTCAEICRTAAHAMLSQATVHTAICGACAQVCEQCAASCQAIGDMDECVRACRTCAESCRTMASGGGQQQSTRTTGSGARASH